MSETRTIGMLGLHDTGKSTYLGALWRLVQDPEVSEIQETDVTGDRSRINMLADRVANGVQLDRTEVDSQEGFELEVRFAGDHVVRLVIPDLAGEAARELVEERVWRASLAATLEHADALMLFIHPDKIDVPVPANFAGADDGDVDEEAEELPFPVAKACTAAKLMELLENVIELRPDLWPTRVAVIISAWDRVDGDPPPRQWLEERLPGVAGFLECNPDRVTAAAFGISAQGGDVQKEKERNALLEKGFVRERVFGRSPTGKPVGLWAPLRWALRFDE